MALYRIRCVEEPDNVAVREAFTRHGAAKMVDRLGERLHPSTLAGWVKQKTWRNPIECPLFDSQMLGRERWAADGELHPKIQRLLSSNQRPQPKRQSAPDADQQRPDR